MNQTKKIETVAPVASKSLKVKVDVRAGRIGQLAGIQARPLGAISLVRTY